MNNFFCVVLALLLAGCSVPGTYMESYNIKASAHTKNRLLNAKIIPLNSQAFYNGVTQDFNAPYEYRVGPYDVLNIVVWNHPELTLSASSQSVAGVTGVSTAPVSSAQMTGAFVNSNGCIVVPLAGEVQVTGLTTLAIKILLTHKFAKFVRHPQVNVQIIAFNSQRVHVIGEVLHSGPHSLTDRPLTILDAINFSGGIDPAAADASNIYVLRQNGKQKILVYWLSAKSPQELILAERFRLVNNDIVYVAPASFVSWSRAVNQILPTIQTIWYTQALFNNN